MSTEVWFRNPTHYIKECVEVGAANISFDRGVIVKQKIDPVKHGELFYGSGIPWRYLIVAPQGTVEYHFGDELKHPTAVYPTWSYVQDEFPILEDLMAQPLAENPEYTESTLPYDERPVKGQEHRVVVTDMPDMRAGAGRAFLRNLKELQEDYQDCILHIHGLYSFRHCFSLGFGAADIEVRTIAAQGKIYMPYGKEVNVKHLGKLTKQINMLGYSAAELQVPRNRCMFNIKSALWAGENFDKLYAPLVKNKLGIAPDTTTPPRHYSPPTVSRPLPSGLVVKPTDKRLCDTCSLSDRCDYFRSGAVCSVPNAETRSLAEMFKTRDSDQIVEGLGTLLAAQTHRAERQMAVEEAIGELDSDVTRMLSSIFDQGVKLAKLVDPNLRSGKVQVNVGAGGQAAILNSTPQQLMSQVVRTLENQGIPREQITQEMVQDLLAAMAGKDPEPKAIAGEVVERHDGAA